MVWGKMSAGADVIVVFFVTSTRGRNMLHPAKQGTYNVRCGQQPRVAAGEVTAAGRANQPASQPD